MTSPYTEPVFLRDEVTGHIVRDEYGNPIIVTEVPAVPPLAATRGAYYGTPQMTLDPMLRRSDEYYASTRGIDPYYHGIGCCATGCCGALGCAYCCDECCDDCALSCERCWWYC